MSLTHTESTLNASMVHQYEDNVSSHIADMLQADQDPIIISSAKWVEKCNIQDIAKICSKKF